AESHIWRTFKPYSNKTKINDKRTEFYQWDNTHNDIEVFSTKGERLHLGSMDPVTGKIYKPAVTGRKMKE
ncbi:MAG: colicin E3/pyocin S6 family cytotoxin, partial [Alphaproteobacteria bacterium]